MLCQWRASSHDKAQTILSGFGTGSIVSDILEKNVSTDTENVRPQGVGKTHLAMAFGWECCLKGYKTYFLRASELTQKLTDARKHGREGVVINGLVKPSCLIIDEIGRCVFDKENTRMFFDVIDRRYNKDGPSTMIFTNNKTPNQWGEYFSEDDTLLCSLDRKRTISGCIEISGCFL